MLAVPQAVPAPTRSGGLVRERRVLVAARPAPRPAPAVPTVSAAPAPPAPARPLVAGPVGVEWVPASARWIHEGAD
jgi:hypothetical protein